jgi:hypothetical protein
MESTRKSNKVKKRYSALKLSATANEFIALIAELGWNDPEAARRLKVSAPFVNMVRNGRRQPSTSLLHMLKMYASRERPKRLGPPPPKKPGADNSWMARVDTATLELLLRGLADTLPDLEAGAKLSALSKITVAAIELQARLAPGGNMEAEE